MSSFQNPVGGPTDPFGGYRAEPIQREKQGSGGEPPKEPPEEKLGITALLLQAFQKMVDFFLRPRDTSKPPEERVKENLLQLKTFFEIMKREDRSQDVQFLNQLSKIWRQTLEDSLYSKEDFKTLVDKIQHHSGDTSHTFGYYLAEYMDQKWLPFPYMELIAKIHSEHEKSPATSALTEWTQLIDKLVTLLQPE